MDKEEGVKKSEIFVDITNESPLHLNTPSLRPGRQTGGNKKRPEKQLARLRASYVKLPKTVRVKVAEMVKAP